MKYRPLNRPKQYRPVAFITDANRDSVAIATEMGERRYQGKLEAFMGLYQYIDYAIYSLVKPKQLMECCGFNRWQVLKFHGKIVNLMFDGRIKVYPLSIYHATPAEIAPFFATMWELGVNAASFSTMALNLWRRTLVKDVWIKEWSDKKIGRASFIGGRKEAKSAPCTLNGAMYLDLPAAYLQGMALPLPCWLREDKVDWYDSGIALATVRIPNPIDPEIWWGPLPSRIGKTRKSNLVTFGWGTDKGFWTLDELRLAKAQGVNISLERVWRGYGERELFREWLELAYGLRRLDGGAGKVAKHVTTRLWGLFGINPEHKKELVSFKDAAGTERNITELEIRNPAGESSTFISSIVASRVRIRAATELLSFRGVKYFDTDGGIVPLGTTISGWRPKWFGELAEIRSAQAYRYRCSKCGIIGGHPDWHYSIAGIPGDSRLCPSLFDYLGPTRIFDVSYQSLTMPAGEINELRRKHPEPEWSPLEGTAA